MRLTSIDMFPANIEEPINFSLHNIDPSARYQIRTVIGIDAEELIQKFYGSSTSGVNYYDFSMNPRDVVIRVMLNPHNTLGESPSDIRDELYRAISANRSGLLRLQFNSGATIVAQIYGYISKFEAAHFNKLPEVQITIRCNDPIFRAINPVIFEEDVLVAMGNPIRIPDGLSTSPHGFEMTATFTGDSPTFTIQDAETSPEWMFQIEPIIGFEDGDELHLSSNYSDKQLYIIRAGDQIHLANAVVVGSLWPILFPFPAENSFYVPEFDDIVWNNVTYYASYWGI